MMINNDDLKRLEKLEEAQGPFPQDVYQVEKRL